MATYASMHTVPPLFQPLISPMLHAAAASQISAKNAWEFGEVMRWTRWGAHQ